MQGSIYGSAFPTLGLGGTAAASYQFGDVGGPGVTQAQLYGTGGGSQPGRAWPSRTPMGETLGHSTAAMQLQQSEQEQTYEESFPPGYSNRGQAQTESRWHLPGTSLGAGGSGTGGYAAVGDGSGVAGGGDQDWVWNGQGWMRRPPSTATDQLLPYGSDSALQPRSPQPAVPQQQPGPSVQPPQPSADWYSTAGQGPPYYAAAPPAHRPLPSPHAARQQYGYPPTEPYQPPSYASAAPYCREAQSQPPPPVLQSQIRAGGLSDGPQGGQQQQPPPQSYLAAVQELQPPVHSYPAARAPSAGGPDPRDPPPPQWQQGPTDVYGGQCGPTPPRYGTWRQMPYPYDEHHPQQGQPPYAIDPYDRQGPSPYRYLDPSLGYRGQEPPPSYSPQQQRPRLGPPPYGDYGSLYDQHPRQAPYTDPNDAQRWRTPPRIQYPMQYPLPGSGRMSYRPSQLSPPGNPSPARLYGHNGGQLAAQYGAGQRPLYSSGGDTVVGERRRSREGEDGAQHDAGGGGVDVRGSGAAKRPRSGSLDLVEQQLRSAGPASAATQAAERGAAGPSSTAPCTAADTFEPRAPPPRPRVVAHPLYSLTFWKEALARGMRPCVKRPPLQASAVTARGLQLTPLAAMAVVPGPGTGAATAAAAARVRTLPGMPVVKVVATAVVPGPGTAVAVAAAGPSRLLRSLGGLRTLPGMPVVQVTAAPAVATVAGGAAQAAVAVATNEAPPRPPSPPAAAPAAGAPPPLPSMALRTAARAASPAPPLAADAPGSTAPLALQPPPLAPEANAQPAPALPLGPGAAPVAFADQAAVAVTAAMGAANPGVAGWAGTAGGNGRPTTLHNVDTAFPDCTATQRNDQSQDDGAQAAARQAGEEGGGGDRGCKQDPSGGMGVAAQLKSGSGGGGRIDAVVTQVVSGGGGGGMAQQGAAELMDLDGVGGGGGGSGQQQPSGTSDSGSAEAVGVQKPTAAGPGGPAAAEAEGGRKEGGGAGGSATLEPPGSRANVVAARATEAHANGAGAGGGGGGAGGSGYQHRPQMSEAFARLEQLQRERMAALGRRMAARAEAAVPP